MEDNFNCPLFALMTDFNCITDFKSLSHSAEPFFCLVLMSVVLQSLLCRLRYSLNSTPCCLISNLYDFVIFMLLYIHQSSEHRHRQTPAMFTHKGAKCSYWEATRTDTYVFYQVKQRLLWIRTNQSNNFFMLLLFSGWFWRKYYSVETAFILATTLEHIEKNYFLCHFHPQKNIATLNLTNRLT